ncbi:unnamed protein product [Rotaria sp. Silwood1]|nr:unnamed protein product [Rotaria sp. Silwood1]CAF1413594.1 unnamed protein product [Rotaria sp. Silwood1]
MLPQHGVSSQRCSPKYIIQANKLQYSTRDTVQITVRGSTKSNTFKGILLVAKTKTKQQIIGTWSAVGSNIRTLNCDGNRNTGITHNSASNKLSIKALWHSPSTITKDPIVIKQIVSGYTSTIPNTRSSTPIPVTTPSIGPQNNSNEVRINWTYENGVTSVKMQINNLKTSQWLALGLSLDNKMGEDHVFVCKRSANDQISVIRCINPLGNSPTVLANTIANLTGTLTPTSLALRNGVAYCEFNLSNFSDSKRRRRDISPLSPSTTYIPLIAIGNLDSSDGMTKHTSRAALSENVQLNTGTQIIYNGDRIA